MNSDGLQFLGIGVLLVLLGGWGAFGPEKWNPLALKPKYRAHVRPSLAKALRVLIGGMILLVGVVVVAIGIAEVTK